MYRILALILLLFSGQSWASICYITQYEDMASDATGAVMPVPGSRHENMVPVTHSVTAQSAVFASWAKYVGIICDGKSFYSFGANPSASDSGPTTYIPADSLFYREVIGGSWRVAFCDSDCA